MSLLQDPNFQMLVTQMASQIDPQGVGKIMGQPAQKFLQRQALSETLTGEGGNQSQTQIQDQESKSGLGSLGDENDGNGFELPDLDSIVDGLIGSEEE